MKIYFDMDGVLADFDAAIAALGDAGGNLNNRSGNLDADARAAKRARWQKIEQTKNFWADIPMMAGIEKLLRAAADMGDLYVLTSAPKAANFTDGENYVDFVAAQKRAWIARHMADFFAPEKVLVVRGGAKEDVVHPTASDLLIDDRAANIDDWVAAGGRGLLFTDVDGAIKDLTFFGA